MFNIIKSNPNNGEKKLFCNILYFEKYMIRFLKLINDTLKHITIIFLSYKIPLNETQNDRINIMNQELFENIQKNNLNYNK